jgi:(1->4)-alpha-D-glucan 1-alpha-D-glucosylmutase
VSTSPPGATGAPSFPSSSVPPGPPSSTYRLQINADFTFDDAAGHCAYLAGLGVTHLYLSPILQAVPGSAHGYDVIDHAQLSAQAGGRGGFDRLVAAAHEQGLELIADVVPNHMAVPVPERLNAPLWSVLRDGRDSPFARWFDIDWTPGQLLMPVLGTPIGAVLAAGELTVDTSGPEPVLRYYEHEFPLRPGTERLDLPELLARQHYRLAWWRLGGDELNYRRFFDVTTLIAIRVEDPEVFAASHALLAELIAEGSLDGLRIDHPDGLADPRGYLRDLAALTGGAWVVAEKILEGDEDLPADWPCAGTTGYDALNVVGGLFVDPAARLTLTSAALPPGRPRRIADYLPVDQQIEPLLAQEITAAKRLVTHDVLRAELNRLEDLLVRICAGDQELRDTSRHPLRQALEALLIEMDRYRAYAVPGEPAPDEAQQVVAAAANRARQHLNDDEQQLTALDVVAALTMNTRSGDRLRDEFVVRFQQTCGPVMAKGIEDTLFYRWLPLIALNEVGADPHRFGYSPQAFHDFCARRQHDWPDGMTTLSTHDTKRSEDARARLFGLSQIPAEWALATAEWSQAAWEQNLGLGTADAMPLVWQTLVAVWDQQPPDPERIAAYLLKALREAKQRTSWARPDEQFEAEIGALVRSVLKDPGLTARINAFVARLAPADQANVLGQKLIQLTMPGVPDVYQGTELVNRYLVDPDNRRPVDFSRRSTLLAPLAGHRSGVPSGLDEQKLLVTTRALSLRREHPDWFGRGADYRPVGVTSSVHLDPGAARRYGWVETSELPRPPAPDQFAVAFSRGRDGQAGMVTVAARFALTLATSGGWGGDEIDLPPGTWTDVLTGRSVGGGRRLLAEVLELLPVALLTR